MKAYGSTMKPVVGITKFQVCG